MTTESTPPPPQQQEEGPSLSKRAFWIMCAKTLAFVFSFALPLLLVRRLSQNEFGLYKQVFLVVSSAVVVLQFNFGMSAFYFLPREPERGRQGQIVFNVLLFNVLAGVLAFLVLSLRPDLLEKIFNSPALVEFAPLIGIVILLWVVSAFLEIVAVAHQELKLATLFIVAAQFTKTALLLGAALAAGSVRALIYAALAQGVLQTVILLVYLRSRFAGFWRKFEWASMRTQLAYALPFALSALLYTMQTDLHSYFVSNRFGPATFAVYAIGCFQLPLIGILAESIGSVMIPRVSYLQKQGETREIVWLTARAARKLAAVYFPLYVFLMLVGREFLVLLFTEQYAASWPVFAVNLTTLPFQIITLGPILRAYKEQRYFMLRLRVVMTVLLVAALWPLTERFGLVGAISVVVGVGLVEHFIMTLRFGRLLGLKRSDWGLLRDVWKLGAAALAAGGVAALVRLFVAGAKPLWVLAACGAAFSLAYLAAVILLRVPSDDERAAVRRRLSSLWRLTPTGKRAAARQPVVPAAAAGAKEILSGVKGADGGASLGR